MEQCGCGGLNHSRYPAYDQHKIKSDDKSVIVINPVQQRLTKPAQNHQFK